MYIHQVHHSTYANPAQYFFALKRNSLKNAERANVIKSLHIFGKILQPISKEVMHTTLCNTCDINIVAAFRGMHVSPAKHSYAWVPRKCDYLTDTHTDGQTGAGQSDPYVPLCFAGDTKKLCNQNGSFPRNKCVACFT